MQVQVQEEDEEEDEDEDEEKEEVPVQVQVQEEKYEAKIFLGSPFASDRTTAKNAVCRSRPLLGSCHLVS